MTTSASIESLITETMQKISAAASSRDLAAVTALSRRAAELEEMKKTVGGVEKRVKELQTPTAPIELSNGQGLRELPVEVTQGMINQNLLTLTEHVKHGRILPGEDMIVEVKPNGTRFRTDVVVNGNKLRERGAIGQFYRDAGVRAGDFVILKEIAQRRWILDKATPGQFKSRNDPSFWIP